MKIGKAVSCTAAVALGVVALSACGGSTKTTTVAATGGEHIGGSVSVWAEWTAAEQQRFEAVLTPFENQTGITANYTPKGSGTLDTALEAAVKGGAPPDIALLPDPGTLRTLAQQGAIKPVDSIVGSSASAYSPAWSQLASHDGKLYGVWFKGANKNTVWYNPAEFAAAGISSPPTSWEQLLQDAKQLKAAGVTPISLCSDVGWPVADLFQNVYLKTAGADSYNKLATHSLKWTDPSVTTAFTTLTQLVGQPSYLLGGTQGALASTYPVCADKVFPKPGATPEAAMVIEGDFVVSEITSNSPTYAAGTTGAGGAKCTADPSKTPCYDFFPFPAPSADSANNRALQGAGNVAVLLHDTPQAEALLKYLASPESAAIWAHLGGFTSPNKGVPMSDYPDSVTQNDAQELVNASSFVFSLDDLQGTWEPDMWKDMLSVVKTPTLANVKAVEQTMDKQATAALGH
jgi:ABC-type glycerol-3-phosphate transport system substrate-binding protein